MQQISRTWKCLTWTQITWRSCPLQWEIWQSSRSWIFRTTILRLTFSTWLISQVFSLLSFPFLFPPTALLRPILSFLSRRIASINSSSVGEPQFLAKAITKWSWFVSEKPGPPSRKYWFLFLIDFLLSNHRCENKSDCKFRKKSGFNLFGRVEEHAQGSSWLDQVPAKAQKFKFVRKWSLFGYLFHLRNWRFFISFFLFSFLFSILTSFIPLRSIALWSQSFFCRSKIDGEFQKDSNFGLFRKTIAQSKAWRSRFVCFKFL